MNSLLLTALILSLLCCHEAAHDWYLGSTIEDVSREEMQRRFAAMFENI